MFTALFWASSCFVFLSSPSPRLGSAQNDLISNKCGTLTACSGADLRPVHFSWNFHPTFFPSGSKPWLTWVSLAFSVFSDASAQCNANSFVSPLNKSNLTLITSHVISFSGAWVPVSLCLLRLVLAHFHESISAFVIICFSRLPADHDSEAKRVQDMLSTIEKPQVGMNKTHTQTRTHQPCSLAAGFINHRLSHAAASGISSNSLFIFSSRRSD